MTTKPNHRVDGTGRRVALALAPLLLLTLFPTPGKTAQPSFRVIVHKSNPEAALPASRVSELFLKKVTRWGSGRRVMPLDLPEGAPARELFSEEIHGRSVSAVKSYWQQQIFSGRDVPPPQKATDSEVVAYVAANPDAIGYVSADADVADVKVLEIR